MVMVMVMVARFGVGRSRMNAEVDALNFGTLLALEVHVKVTQIQLGQFPFQGGRFHSEVAQGADSHVAADAGEAVEIERFHGWQLSVKASDYGLQRRRAAGWHCRIVLCQ